MSSAFNRENPPLARTLALVALALAAYVGLAWLIPDRYYQLIFTIILIWAVVGVAFNLFSGYSGLLSFGHAAFFGLGAYAVALLYIKFGISPWFGILVAAAVGGLAGVTIGYPTFRLRGHYFALAMLAYPLVLLYLFQWLGYQEESLPMARENPAAYMQFAAPASISRSRPCCSSSRSPSTCTSRARVSGSRCLPSSRTSRPRGGRHQSVAAEAVRDRAFGVASGGGGAVRDRAAGGHPESMFGVLVSSRALIVTFSAASACRRAGGRRAGADPARRDPARASSSHVLPGIQGVVLGIAIIAVVLLAPDGILPWVLRPLPQEGPEGRALGLATAPYARETPPPAEGQGAPILEVREVAVRFGGLQALANVTFEVKAGEILGIIGPNGAGKTTLFNIMNGFIAPTWAAFAFRGTSSSASRRTRSAARAWGARSRSYGPSRRFR